MCGSRKMFPIVVFISLLSLVTAATGSTENKTQYEKCNKWRIETFVKIQSCVRDFIQNNGSCLNMDDVRKSYVSRIKSDCISNDFVDTFNRSIYLRMNLIEHVVNNDEIQGFYKANGTNCIRSRGPEILQCVEDAIKDRNKTTIHTQMRYSLLRLKPFQLEDHSFAEIREILNCTIRILKSSCNQTIPFVTSIGDYVLQKFVKYKQPKERISPPPASRSNTITIIVVVVVIVLLALTFIIIKKILWPRWRKRSSANYQCTYTPEQKECVVPNEKI